MLDSVALASCGVDGTAEGRQCPAKMPKRRPCKARRCRPSRTGRLPSSASIPAVDLGGLFAQSSRAQYSMARGHRGSGSCHGCQRLTNATSHDAILTLKTLAFGTAVNTFRGMMLPYFPISGRKVGFASITGIYGRTQTRPAGRKRSPWRTEVPLLPCIAPVSVFAKFDPASLTTCALSPSESYEEGQYWRTEENRNFHDFFMTSL